MARETMLPHLDEAIAEVQSQMPLETAKEIIYRFRRIESKVTGLESRLANGSAIDKNEPERS